MNWDNISSHFKQPEKKKKKKAPEPKRKLSTLVNTLDDMMHIAIDLHKFLAEGCPAEETGDKTGTHDK